MRKQSGFVFMETVVVVCVLSVTLLILYASYAHILRASREKKTFDTTDSIYTTYNVKKIINNYGDVNSFFVSNKPGTCSRLSSGGYVCDMSRLKNNSSNYYYQLYKVYNVDKLYYLSPNYILTSSNKKTYLMELDATTIDYVQSLGIGTGINNTKILIVKYKHEYSDGTYEVTHASMEV